MPKAVIEEAARPPVKLIQVFPAQIELDSVTDVRSGSLPKDEEARIDDLAQHMFKQGQIQPIVVRPNSAPDHYLLVAGRRRLAAAKRIEEQTQKPWALDAIISERDDEQAWATAIHENLQRRQFSPIEFANLVMDVKKRLNATGGNWTQPVAEFLHVSRATVSQSAKLLKLQQHIQDKVHSGLLSAAGALEMIEIDEQKREEVAARAEELAEEEERSKPRAAKKTASTPAKGSSTQPTPLASSKKGVAEDAEKGAVKRKHVLKAAREVQATTKARTRGEMVTFWTDIIESADPYSDEITDFASYLVNKWATGQASDRQLRNRLDAIDEKIARKRKTA